VARERLRDELSPSWDEDDEVLAAVRRVRDSTDQACPLRPPHQPRNGSPGDEQLRGERGRKEPPGRLGEELHEEHPFGVGESKPREVNLERGIRIPRQTQQLEEAQQCIGAGTTPNEPLDTGQLRQLSQQ
jgi:hypothetical protein